MARANRLNGVGDDGGVFHVTHQCHNRAFFFKSACDRDTYRIMVWEHLRRFNVSVLDYCLTSNHLHLLGDTPVRMGITGFMRDVASLAKKVAGDTSKREPCWTESLAVGSLGS
jgi:putative transposase